MLADRWARMLIRQYQLQTETFGFDPPLLQGRERGDYVTWNVVALEDELHEAMQELSWKPWATDDFFNREAYLDELVDAFHFLLNLVFVAGKAESGYLDLDELSFEFFTRYMKKAQINVERQKTPGGFKTLGTKCPDCGRAIEAGERDTLQDQTEINEVTWQDQGGYRGDVGRRDLEAYRCLCGRVNYLVAAPR